MDTQLMTELLRVSGAATDAGILDWIKIMLVVPGAMRLLGELLTPPPMLRHAS
jgi:hypothetical protein